MKPVREFLHISGEGLLAYFQKQGLNVTRIKYGNPPSILLNRYGESNSLGLVVNMLLDDKDGALSGQFAERCKSYGENSPNKVDVLGKLFQRFVQEVLFSPTTKKSKETTPGNSPRTIHEDDQSQLDNFFNQIDSDLDHWAEKYEDILRSIDRYVTSLEQIFHNPVPADWKYDEFMEFGTEPREDVDYIPNKYLRLLIRMLGMFGAKVSIWEKRINQAEETEEKLSTTDAKSMKDELNKILEVTISIKNMRWDVFESYPYEHQIIDDIEGVIDDINALFLATNKPLE